MVSDVNSTLPSSPALMVWLTAQVYPVLVFTGKGIEEVSVPHLEKGVG